MAYWDNPLMKSNITMKSLSYAFCFLLCAFDVFAQMQTYSPYTPAQINEFNNQPLSPAQTPAGPIYLNHQPPPKPRSTVGAHYFSQPLGEEEAEAQETESATPFTPSPTTFQF